MFADCDTCGYDSGDHDELWDVEEQVRQDGGHVEPGAMYCPECSVALEVHL